MRGPSPLGAHANHRSFIAAASPPLVTAKARARRFVSCGLRKLRTRAAHAMKHPRTLTVAHWGVYEVEYDETGEAIKLHPFVKDPDPSPIGLHMLSDEVERLRVPRPAVRKSCLEQGPGASPERPDAEPFDEILSPETLDPAA